MNAFTVSMSNLKGGVGKSSTTFHLAGTLAAAGRRVVLVDADPQASLTQGFFGPDVTRALPRRETIAGYFGDGLTPDGGSVARPTGFENIRILPGSPLLTDHNLPAPHREPRDQQRALVPFVRDLRGDCDFILIDTPPTLSLCTWAALVASDALVVPLQAEDFGSQGIAYVLDSIEAIRAKANPGLRLLGYLLTMFNPRLAIHATYRETLRAIYGGDVFEATIPIATDYKEAVALRRPVALHKPRGAASRAMKAFADELIARSHYTVQDARKEAV